MYKYAVERVEHTTPSTILLTLRPNFDGKYFSFLPGQYATISFAHGIRPSASRCFSIVSSPTDQLQLQFAMREKGYYTRRIARLAAGDTVTVQGPFGGFVVDPIRDANLVLIAGGIGITPFMSMLRYMTAIQSTMPITLLYGCQSQNDIPFLNELIELQRVNNSLRVVYVIAEGETTLLNGQTVVPGRINESMLSYAVNNAFSNKSFFICGPPPFMRAQVSTLEAKQVSKHNIITEAFAQGSHRQTGKVQSWPYNIYALGIISLVVTSFIVIANDFFKNLPANNMISTDTAGTQSPLLTSNRQADLDTMVNALASTSNGAPDTPSVISAFAAVDAANREIAAQNNSTTPVSSVRTSTTTTVPTTATPAPAPQKQCTTTQSGKTVCV